MSFNISDKVVCIYNFRKTEDNPHPPVKGRIYVVRGIHQAQQLHLECRSGVGLKLVGLMAVICGQEVGFCACRFRKLDDIKSENANRDRKLEPA